MPYSHSQLPQPTLARGEPQSTKISRRNGGQPDNYGVMYRLPGVFSKRTYLSPGEPGTGGR